MHSSSSVIIWNLVQGCFGWKAVHRLYPSFLHLLFAWLCWKYPTFTITIGRISASSCLVIFPFDFYYYYSYNHSSRLSNGKYGPIKFSHLKKERKARSLVYQFWVWTRKTIAHGSSFSHQASLSRKSLPWCHCNHTVCTLTQGRSFYEFSFFERCGPERSIFYTSKTAGRIWPRWRTSLWILGPRAFSSSLLAKYKLGRPPPRQPISGA